MTRLVYLAHPVRPAEGESLADNFDSAQDYRTALEDAGILVVAPWLWELQDRLNLWVPRAATDAEREAIMQRCEAYAAAWAVAPVGWRITEGMQAEIDACGRHIRGLLGLSPAGAAQVVRDFVLEMPEGWS